MNLCRVVEIALKHILPERFNDRVILDYVYGPQVQFERTEAQPDLKMLEVIGIPCINKIKDLPYPYLLKFTAKSFPESDILHIDKEVYVLLPACERFIDKELFADTVLRSLIDLTEPALNFEEYGEIDLGPILKEILSK